MNIIIIYLLVEKVKINSKEIAKSVIKWEEEGKSSLLSIKFFPTDRCVTHCRFCPRGLDISDTKISIEKWIEIVKQANELGVKEWEISGGGDPFASKAKTLAIVKEIKTLNPNTFCEIITNGLNINEEDIYLLIEYGLDKLKLSLEGATSNFHDYLVNFPGAFNKIIKVLDLFKKYKSKLHTSKPEIIFNSILTYDLYKEIDDFILLAKKYDVKGIDLHSLILFPNTEKNMKKHALPISKIHQIRKDMKKLEKKCLKDNMLFWHPWSNEEDKTTNLNKYEKNENQLKSQKITNAYCYEPFYSMLIDWNGHVAGCVVKGMGEHKVNLRNKSLSEIWDGDYFEKLRLNSIKNIKNDYCKKCIKGNTIIPIKKNIMSMQELI